MLKDAEKFAKEDREARERTEARNKLEGYIYSMKNTLSDSDKGIADKISEEDKEKLQKVSGFIRQFCSMCTPSVCDRGRSSTR